MLRESSDRLCIISLSLTRWITIRSESLKHRASVASILVSCELAVAELGLSECGVSGRMIRNVSLKGVAISKCERCSGTRKFSMASSTAFRVRALDDCNRKSRVSRFTEYWIDAPTRNWETSRRARNCGSQSREAKPRCGTIVDTY